MGPPRSVHSAHSVQGASPARSERESCPGFFSVQLGSDAWPGAQLGHWPKDLGTCLGGKVPEEKETVSVHPQGWDKGVRGILKQRDP